MFLPNRHEAFIPPAKLFEYLLSSTHAVGKSKSKFFAQFGFNLVNAGLLESGLLAIAHTEQVLDVINTPYGIKYILDGRLLSPTGSIIRVRTVWLVELDSRQPRFVTAHPLPKQPRQIS